MDVRDIRPLLSYLPPKTVAEEMEVSLFLANLYGKTNGLMFY